MGRIVLGLFLGLLLGGGLVFQFHPAVTEAVNLKAKNTSLEREAARVKQELARARETPGVKVVPLSEVRVVEKPVMVDGELIRLSREIARAWREGRQTDARTLAAKAAPLARRFRIVCDGPLGEEVWRDPAGAVEIPKEAESVYYVAEGQ